LQKLFLPTPTQLLNPGRYKMIAGIGEILEPLELIKEAIRNKKPAACLLEQMLNRLDGILRTYVSVMVLHCAAKHEHFETLEWLLQQDAAYAQTVFRATLNCYHDSPVLPWLATMEIRIADWHPGICMLALMHPRDQHFMWLRPHIPKMAMRHADAGAANFDMMLADNDFAVGRFLGAFSPDEGAALLMLLFRRGRTRGFSLLMRGDITKMRAVALADGGKVLRAGWQRRGLARRWRACLCLTPSDLVSAGLRY
jgi:hypothetical protein